MKQVSSKTILVIEDNAVTRNLYIDGLSAEGFNTIGAENGTIGIQKAQLHLPDLIVCDISMPDINGYDVLTALKEDPVTAIIPFIFLAGSGDKTDVRKGMELGADDYVIKPSTIDELTRAIATQLRKQKHLKEWYTRECNQILENASPNQNAASKPESIFPKNTQLQEVFDYIEANFHLGITLCDVASAVGYSAAYLTHRVAKQTGDTVNGWIVQRRMAAARELLQESKQTIEQISTALGYQNACHFSRQFRQHHDIPPQTWRKKHQSMRRLRNMLIG
ncbi:two component transcriptional regulator, AraC family protein [Calothrix sp. NIES-4071]|nr:two component transcriptional regulator, AraC family protein [Calothrix sp. NIES-4071]BAZ59997.1 two component transcriptional regulator, AraC family protein [Calothrix sp. NIES-4105]